MNGTIQQYEHYLGLLILGRSNRRAFEDLKNKVWQKLQTWKEKLFSQGVKKFSRK